MNQEQQIKALAELDGLAERYAYELKWQGGSVPFIGIIPSYLTSYDAIIPLIQKQSEQIIVKMWSKFATDFKHPTTERFISELFDGWLRLTPTQLAEALLRATGKWKD